MSVTRTFKVYGAEGHRQRFSFAPSGVYDWSEGDAVRIVEIQNADVTGTHDYTIVKITRNSADECLWELDGQVSDGFFEDCRVGKILEVQNGG